MSSEEEDKYCSTHTTRVHTLYFNIDISERHDVFGLHREAIDHAFATTLGLTSFDKDGPVQYFVKNGYTVDSCSASPRNENRLFPVGWPSSCFLLFQTGSVTLLLFFTISDTSAPSNSVRFIGPCCDFADFL